VAFVIFVVNEIKVIVPGYPHGSLKIRFLRGELLDFLRSLDGCRVDEALQNGRERSSYPDDAQIQTTT
jgi:hypothetical protein